MKPTYSTISLEGIKPVSCTIDSFGFFARSIEDLQLVADTFALKDKGPPVMISLEQSKVALLKTPIWPIAGPGTIAAMKKAAEIFKNHGVEVEEVAFPSAFSDVEALKMMHKRVFIAETQVAFLKEYQMDKTKLGSQIRDLVENKPNFAREEIVEALDRYASMRSIFDEIAANFSVTITPSAVDEAPLGLGDMGDSGFNFLWTVSPLL